MGTGKPRLITCGTIVTDGLRLLAGHATGSPRWDIPKGLREAGDDCRQAAIRELREETGLCASPDDLVDLGMHRYRRGKDLALFVLRVVELPDPATLRCSSMFTARDGRVVPEFDRFDIFPRERLGDHLGKSLVKVLGRVAWSDAGSSC